MSAIRSNGALWQSGEHRLPSASPIERGEAGRLAAIEIVALRRELARSKGRVAELERRLALAEAEALSAQIAPHFLCNALQAVSTLLHRDANAADAMVVALSGLLRMALHAAAAGEVSLTNELAMAERYAQVMRLRFGADLRVVADIQPETRDALVPHLVLQPLVENAILHGFGDDRAGTIRVTAERRGQLLRCAVSDDGRGLCPGPVVERIGLGGTRGRLRALFGERHEFEVTRNAAGGVTVRLALPFRVPIPMTEVES